MDASLFYKLHNNSLDFVHNYNVKFLEFKWKHQIFH